MRRLVLATVIAASALSGPARAQDAGTLADIRQELTVLHVEIQRLKRELSTTGAPGVQVSGGTVLDRVTAIESALTRLTARTEQLEYRIQRIVEDGTRRIGDLEFRLVELEGGDVSQLGETTTLGGELPVPEAPATPQPSEPELAIGERADFDAARAALDDGRFAEAAEGFAAFAEAYPGSPLAAQAALRRGDALSGLGDTREAARAYLAAFSAEPTGPHAAEALTRLGGALGALGQMNQACVTLGEVSARFPLSDWVGEAAAEMDKLGCG